MATQIAHRAARLPHEAYAVATAYLEDTLEWLNLWNWNNAPADQPLDDFHYTEQHRHTLDL